MLRELARKLGEFAEPLYTCWRDDLVPSSSGRIDAFDLADTEKTHILLPDGRYVRTREGGRVVALPKWLRINA